MNRESAWQEAYKWLCQQRKNAPADSDVWHLRFHWERDGEAFRQRVEQGEYRLKAMRVVKRLSDDPIAIWDADDAMVLKWVALQIQDVMPVHPKCHHVKGAGVHYSRREVKDALDSGEYKFVYRTDIRGYYQHMQKSQLNALVQKWVKDPILLDLVEQYIAYSVEDGGEFHTPVDGISRGCALSPLLGASLLFHIDEMFAEKTDLFYARYMDDFLVLSKKRWPLRRAIRLLNEQMNAGDFTLHPNKTQIGRVEKGFDWLGLWFDEEGVRRSTRSLQTRASKILRLYEQIRSRVEEINSTIRFKKFAPLLTVMALTPTITSGSVLLDVGLMALDTNTTPSDGVAVSGPTSSVVASNDYDDTWQIDPITRSAGTYPGSCVTGTPLELNNITLGGWGVRQNGDSSDVMSAGQFPLSPPIGLTGDVLFAPLTRCPNATRVPGPFTVTVATIIQKRLRTEIAREDVVVSGSWALSTCSVSTRNVDLGDMVPGVVGSNLRTLPVTIISACNTNFPGYGPSSISFSSPASDGNLLLAAPTDPVGVTLTYVNGQMVQPGAPVALQSDSSGLPQSTFTVSVVQRSADAIGSFSIPVDVVLNYN